MGIYKNPATYKRNQRKKSIKRGGDSLGSLLAILALPLLPFFWILKLFAGDKYDKNGKRKK